MIDAWVAGDHGNVVDRALKMTSRGGYAFGGAPVGFAAATGAPINFAPAAGAFTGLPSPGSLNLAPSKATMAAILASRPTTRMGSGEPVKLSPYTPPAIPARRPHRRTAPHSAHGARYRRNSRPS